MKKQPLVSIIIPTYNRTDTLIRAIKSALQQTYVNIEIIVVDDNAEKLAVRNWVNKKLKNNENVKLIKNKSNLGGALSRNVGIKNAKGDFISFLDDDDIFSKNKIELQYNLYKNRLKKDSKLGLIYCFVHGINSENMLIAKYEQKLSGNPIVEQMLNNIAVTSSWFLPKKIIEDIGYFEDTPSKQDSIVLLKILAKGYNISCVEEPLVYYLEDNTDNKISGYNYSNIVGVKNYRSWCRKKYYLLSEKEVNEIECNFSKQLLNLYIINNYKKESFKEVQNICELKPFSKVCFVSIVKFMFSKLYRRFVKYNTTKRLKYN